MIITRYFIKTTDLLFHKIESLINSLYSSLIIIINNLRNRDDNTIDLDIYILEVGSCAKSHGLYWDFYGASITAVIAEFTVRKI